MKRCRWMHSYPVAQSVLANAWEYVVLPNRHDGTLPITAHSTDVSGWGMESRAGHRASALVLSQLLHFRFWVLFLSTDLCRWWYRRSSWLESRCWEKTSLMLKHGSGDYGGPMGTRRTSNTELCLAADKVMWWLIPWPASTIARLIRHRRPMRSWRIHHAVVLKTAVGISTVMYVMHWSRSRFLTVFMKIMAWDRWYGRCSASLVFLPTCKQWIGDSVCLLSMG